METPQTPPIMVPGYVLVNPPPAPKPAPEPKQELSPMGFLGAFFWAAVLLLTFWFITGGYETLK